MAKEPSWLCTLIIQLSLCFAVYVALNLGQPQKSIYQRTHGIRNRKSLDFYFISVTGGFRPHDQETLLLKQELDLVLISFQVSIYVVELGFWAIICFLYVNIRSFNILQSDLLKFFLLMKMENVAESYDARFVVSTSQLGEDDPLKQNATSLFPSLKVPWYTTKASKEKEVGCFQEQMKLPNGETLDIIGVDTGSLLETMLTALSSGTEDNQLNWLKRTLEATRSHWCIVVGFHPLVVCEEHGEQPDAMKMFESLHHIFMKYGVNAYLSKHGCTKYARQDSITYFENPDLNESGNGREMVDGFLLHGVSSLEIVTYFVTSEGEIVYRTVTHQRGKEVM